MMYIEMYAYLPMLCVGFRFRFVSNVDMNEPLSSLEGL